MYSQGISIMWFQLLKFSDHPKLVTYPTLGIGFVYLRHHDTIPKRPRSTTIDATIAIAWWKPHQPQLSPGCLHALMVSQSVYFFNPEFRNMFFFVFAWLLQLIIIAKSRLQRLAYLAYSVVQFPLCTLKREDGWRVHLPTRSTEQLPWHVACEKLRVLATFRTPFPGRLIVRKRTSHMITCDI